MDFQPRDHFAEHDDPDVERFTIIDESDVMYQIAEKSDHATAYSGFLQYWIPKGKLTERVEDGLCEKVGQVSEEQLEKLERAAGFDPETRSTESVAAE